MERYDDSALYRRSAWPRVFTHHVLDLQMMLVFSLAALIFVISLIWYAPTMWYWIASQWFALQSSLFGFPAVTISRPSAALDPNSARITATAVLLAAWTGLAIRIASQTNERLGTVDLFLYQIVATCRVMAAVDMVAGFTKLYADTKPKGFANIAGEEDYFSHFDAMGQAIGDLNRADVARITEFFTHLKASRDATRAFIKWTDGKGEHKQGYPDEARRLDVLHVIYLLFLVLEAAHYCVEGLARKKEQGFLRQLIGPQMTEAHAFLTATLAPEDGRFHLLRMDRRTKLIREYAES